MVAMPSPRLLLFDIDGTLLDIAGAGRVAVERAFKQVLGVGNVTARARGVRYAGRTDPRIFADVARAAGVSSAVFEAERPRLLRRFLAEMRAELARDGHPRRALPGVRILLESLARRNDVRLGLLTGNVEEGAWIKLRAVELDRYFDDGGFASDHADRRVIARVAHEKLCATHGTVYPPARVVVVGDTGLDVDCARANGFRAVAVATGGAPREELERARPDALLDDLADLPAALAALGLSDRADG